MEQPSASSASIIAVIDFLEREDRTPFGRLGRRRRRAMIARLRAELGFAAPGDVLAATRLRWAGDYRVRVPDRSRVRVDPDGMWVMAWLLAGEALPGRDLVDPQTITDALAGLPLLPREVFVLHRRDGLDFRAIGQRLGLSEAVVCEAMVSALRGLDGALFPD